MIGVDSLLRRPMLEHYRPKGVVSIINGDQGKDQVWGDIEKVTHKLFECCDFTLLSGTGPSFSPDLSTCRLQDDFLVGHLIS